MSYFGLEPGELEITFWHADNKIVSAEVQFSVPASEWTEFQKLPCYQELKAQLESYRRRIPDTHIDSHGQECKLEIQPCGGDRVNSATHAMVQSIVNSCPSFDGKAVKGLMEFVYNTDLSLDDYYEIANMITTRMYQYADQEVATIERERRRLVERIAAVGIFAGLTVLVAAVTAGIVTICLR